MWQYTAPAPVRRTSSPITCALGRWTLSSRILQGAGHMHSCASRLLSLAKFQPVLSMTAHRRDHHTAHLLWLAQPHNQLAASGTQRGAQVRHCLLQELRPEGACSR